MGNEIELLAFTLDAVGKVLIAYTAIRVHYRVRKEHKIDDKVFSSMKREQALGVWGIIFIVAGYFLHVFVLV
jgi:hypothetical protein